MKLYCKKIERLVLVLIVVLGLFATSAKGKGDYNIPKISGKLVYHSYSSYEEKDSKLYLFNFDNNENICLSDKFDNIYNAMNANFSKDGSKIVFMGMEKDRDEDKWDIYTYNLQSGCLENLTENNDLRNEDPKFSPDGEKVIFKQGHWDEDEDDMVYDLKELDLKSKKVKSITKDLDEDSMPFYSEDGKTIYYARGIGENSKIYKVGRYNVKDVKKIYSSKGVMCYYPIVYGNNLYFTRWYSKSNSSDMIMKMDLKTKEVTKLKFNNKNYNCSDPCPISEEYMIISSTKGDNGYDLYFADINTGETWPLSKLNSKINDEREQLGASCFIESVE